MKKIIFILLSVSMLCFLGACNAERPTQIEVTNMPNSSSKVVATSETTRNPVSPSPNSTSDAATMPPSDSEFILTQILLVERIPLVQTLQLGVSQIPIVWDNFVEF